MKRSLFLIILFSLTILKALAQSVTVDASIDSLQILIGEQAKIKIQVSLDANKRAIFPVYNDTIIKGVEIVDIAKPDTQYLNDRKRLMITQEYTVTSFDSALYYLPPMKVLVDNKPYLSKALALKVYSIPVDTVHADKFFGPKTIMQAPFVWSDWYGVIICIILIAPFIIRPKIIPSNNKMYLLLIIFLRLMLLAFDGSGLDGVPVSLRQFLSNLAKSSRISSSV